MNISLERDVLLIILVTDFIPLTFSNFKVPPSVGIVTWLQTGKSGDRIAAEALGPHTTSYSEVLSPQVHRPERQSGNSRPFSDEVKNEYSCSHYTPSRMCAGENLPSSLSFPVSRSSAATLKNSIL